MSTKDSKTDKQFIHSYSKSELRVIKRKVEKAESEYLKAIGNIEALAEYVQPFYENEIGVSATTDGAMITDTNGELCTVKSTLGI